MREGDKKQTFKKQKMKLFLEKVMRANKKNIGHISGKVNEGDEKNKQKKHSWKNIFYLLK